MLVAALFVRARDGRRGAEATRTPRALPGSCGQSGAGRKKRGDNPPPSRRGRNSCPVASVDFHAAGDRAARCSDVNRPQASAGSTSARYSSGVAPIRDNIATIACEATAREGHNAGLDKPLDGELSAVTRSRGRRRIRCREGESNPHAHEGAPRSERGVSAIPPPRHSSSCARRERGRDSVDPEGVEPSHSHHDGHQHLKLACLPFHHGPLSGVRCGGIEPLALWATILRTACGNHPLSHRAMSGAQTSLQ
jgi:hypothetical protein